jgi:predicted ATP-grasp superfamily ATP-dependent carboligase
MTRVLITDGESRSALAATRSLGRAGYRIMVTGSDPRSIAFKSKYCSESIRVPDPLADGARYRAEILRLVAAEAVDFIFPMTEQSIYLLNPVRARFGPHAILACPAEDTFNRIADKAALFRLAEKLGIPAPMTLYLEGPGDLPEAKRKIRGYPVVVKPARSRIPTQSGFLSASVAYAAGEEDLDRLYGRREALRHPSMIQELIVGPGTGVFTLFDRVRSLALFSHRRLLEKPPSGGVSVVSESTPLDPEMVAAAEKLLAAFEFSGVAMVEFKRDQRDGKAKLMEINGRFWGTLQLAIASGVDFPRLLLAFLKGEKAEAPSEGYRVGHKLKWFFGILDHMLIRCKSGRNCAGLAVNQPPKARALLHLVNLFERNASFDVLDPRDPAPFWREARSYLAGAIRRLPPGLAPVSRFGR